MIFHLNKTKRLSQRPSIWLTLIAVWVTATSAPAQIVVTGDYSPDEPFWSNGGSDQQGFIGSSSDGSLTLGSGSVVEVHQITLGQSSGATGTVVVEDSGSYLDIQQNLHLGYDGTGNLTVQNGGKVTTEVNETFLGHSATAAGTALVTGEGSYMSSKDDMLVGYYGTGTLRVEDGGYVLAERHLYIGYYDGSVSSATVTGSGSELYTPSRMYIGLYGTGTLNVADGAKVTVGYYVYLGHYGRDSDPGRGNGTANITGEGTEFNVAGNLNVGYWGDGELNVENGATVTSANGYISYRFTAPQTRGTGIATITGAGSAWNISESMVVGRGGDGTLNIEDEGVVNSAAGYLGTMDTTSLGLGGGTVTVTGSGSQWNITGGVDAEDNVIAGNLYVGHDSTGKLNVENGGLVTTSGDGYIGYNTDSSGTVVVSGTGSRWEISGDLYVGSSGTGTLSISDGGGVTAGGWFDQAADGSTVVDGGTLSFSHFKDTTAPLGTISISDPEGGSALTVGADDGVTSTFAGVIQDYSSGPGSVTKTGSNTVVLAGDNTYTSATLIDAGTLVLGSSGSLTSSEITVASGAIFDVSAVSGGFTLGSGQTLSGSGAVSGAVTIGSGAFLAPGNSPGTLSTDNTTFVGGGTYYWQLNDATGTAGTNWDLLAVSGTLDLSGLSSASLFTIALQSLTTGNAAGNVANFDATQDYSYTIATASSGIIGFDAGNLALSTSGFTNALNGGSWSLTSDGSNLSLNFTAAAVPEPAAWATLFGLSAMVFTVWRKRRRVRHSS